MSISCWFSSAFQWTCPQFVQILFQMETYFFLQLLHCAGIILMNNARNPPVTKFSIIFITVHIIEKENPCILFPVFILCDDIGPIESQQRSVRGYQQPVSIIGRRKYLCVIPLGKSSALYQYGHPVPSQELAGDGGGKQTFHVAPESIEVPMNQFNFSDCIHSEIELDHIIHGFFIKKRPGLPAGFFILIPERIVNPSLLPVNPFSVKCPYRFRQSG